jgi:PilZ domain
MPQNLQCDQRELRHQATVFVQGRLTTISSEDTGYVSDLSVEGMRMLSARAPEEGEVVGLSLFLPDEDGARHEIALEGRCSWKQPAQLPGLFDCGFRFSSLQPEQIAGLKTLLDATTP